MKPSLTDLGLDDTWDHEDPANLSKVLKKLSYMMQVKYHHAFFVKAMKMYSESLVSVLMTSFSL